jgi:hypothetical protein
MKRKYFQLVEHSEPWPHYAVHEALIDDNEILPYWVGSKPIRKYAEYAEAMDAWCKMEPKSAYMDIYAIEDVEELFDRIDYSENEEELNFED